VAAEDLALEVEPLLADQALHLSVRFWEGAVRVSGTACGRPVQGSGYLELTGYAGAGG
jgi:predicted secreted hydrolase